MKHLLAALVLGLVAAPALAAEPFAAADAIKAAVAGNTVEGSMTASGKYTEFYAEDGAIKGAGYTGAWRVTDESGVGAMCFQYGTDPENCWNVRIVVDQVVWVKDGVEEGSGTIVAGNPNGF